MEYFFMGNLRVFDLYPPRKLTCPLKIDGWKMIHFLLGRLGLFSGAILVFGGVMSLPFSRFRLIKGLLATCLSHIGAFFLGGCGMGWGWEIATIY